MKLIDLLVKELPKRGGWPEGMVSVAQSLIDGELYFYSKGYDGTGADFKSIYCLDLCDEHLDSLPQLPSITKEQYESALAASQKQAWNGGGLPPAGVECEARLRCNDAEWFFFRCVAVDCGVAFGWAGNEAATLGKGSYEFRPLRTESERKHEAVLESICAVLEMVAQDYKREDEAKLIYEAIAAGKIPGVKLDD